MFRFMVFCTVLAGLLGFFEYSVIFGILAMVAPE